MKTKFIIFCALSVLISFSSIAQDRAKNFIGFTLGASIPTGDFAKAEAGTFNNWNNKAGFANTGFAAGVEGAYYFLPHIGVGGTLYYAQHGGFSQTDAAKLGASYTDAFGVDASTVTTSGNYSSLNLMAGPYFSFPVNKFTFDIRLLGGLLKSLSTPEMTVVLEDNTAAPLQQNSSTGSAFGWQVGAGFRYTLTDKLGLMFRADYFNSDGVKIENEHRENRAGRLVTKQPMSWVNTSVGLSFSLGK
ncbi:outer membrane beta-barrel protein [Chryseolinea soli]|uniref:Outer membrane protein beta-barrel domain-containing protein n=1 Tax=Chryseolinea soli TaxID=2321403 RepID=A0A385SXP2_9BACT|nr:outer membrane beta-barrel protein [Chryseolinea soli]AYB34847.1 hypothetical protein D4L85_31585 [Chryseolinea soli]